MHPKPEEKLDLKRELLELKLSMLTAADRAKQREVELEKTVQEIGRAAYGARRALEEMQGRVEKLERKGTAGGRPLRDPLKALGLR